MSISQKPQTKSKNSQNKIITIRGSMHFFKEIQNLQNKLEILGFKTFVPNMEGLDTDYSQMTTKEQVEIKHIEIKHKFINDHIAKIKQSDAILVANFDKKNQENCIGANTFLEMAFAYILDKLIFILNNIPINQNNSTEILGLKPTVLLGNLQNLNFSD